MTAAEVFRRILGAVESAGIPYMLTGSFASSYHGAPRATQDIDLVIDGRELYYRETRQENPFLVAERIATTRRTASTSSPASAGFRITRSRVGKGESA